MRFMYYIYDELFAKYVLSGIANSKTNSFFVFGKNLSNLYTHLCSEFLPKRISRKISVPYATIKLKNPRSRLDYKVNASFFH